MTLWKHIYNPLGVINTFLLVYPCIVTDMCMIGKQIENINEPL